METNRAIRVTPLQKRSLKYLAGFQDPEEAIGFLEIRERSSLTRGGFQEDYSLTEKGWGAINAFKKEQP
jgi:hypothetical protein